MCKGLKTHSGIFSLVVSNFILAFSDFEIKHQEKNILKKRKNKTNQNDTNFMSYHVPGQIFCLVGWFFVTRNDVF